ncbi:MAG TPA: helix-turn-helix transcriptional regulator [Kofleriaceae bacterium]|nr:helix-turn-helix transcriptional regulator [Kofleriaceae bacterium]
MPIIVRLDVELARRKMRLNELAERTGISVPNLSILKGGKARAIRFSTLEAICAALGCTPGDLLEYDASDPHPREDVPGLPRRR